MLRKAWDNHDNICKIRVMLHFLLYRDRIRDFPLLSLPDQFQLPWLPFDGFIA